MKDDFRPVAPVEAADQSKQTHQINQQPEPQQTFLTPEQMLARGDRSFVGSGTHSKEHMAAESSSAKLRRLPFSLPPKRKLIAITGSVAITLIAILGFIQVTGSGTGKQATKVASTKQAVAPLPTTEASTLSGLPVPAEVNRRPIVGVMIENSKAARPQAGLSQAGVVFEAVAEGGITRFLAMFQDQQPGNAGPIRSARPYYVQWNEGFRAAYAHVGGSPDALATIKSLGVQDINQFYNSAPYRRDGSRPSPHNMYAGVADLAQVAINKGFKSSTQAFAARKQPKPAAQPTATSIDLTISSALYNVRYAYDAKSNSYPRSMAGTPHTDANGGAQLAPSVVVAMIMPMSVGKGGYSMYNPIGSGQALIFQDGTVTDATWHKASPTAQLSLTDAGGGAIRLNPGQTWISAVTARSKVTFQ